MKSERPEIYFLHVPKTAGSSLASLIRNAYPQQESIPAYEWQQLVQINRKQINGYRCYHGHFGTGLYSLLDRPIPTVTILRDPFERAVSHQLHAERLPMLRYGPTSFLIRQIRLSWERSHNLRLREWIERSFVRVLLRDFQTRSLGVDVDLNPLLGKPSLSDYAHLVTKAEQGQRMEDVLERAKRRLDAKAVVGTVERFYSFTALICDYLGIAEPKTASVLNVARSGPSRRAIAPGHRAGSSYRDSGIVSPKLAALIDSLTEYDRELYKYGSHLLEARLQSRHRALPAKE